MATNMTDYIPERSARRVKLLCDLTHYRRGLVAGTLGWTTSARSEWGVMVRYDGGHILDTLWRSLETLEEETNANKLRFDLLDFNNLVCSLLENGVTPATLRQRITQLAPAPKRKPKGAV